MSSVALRVLVLGLAVTVAQKQAIHPLFYPLFSTDQPFHRAGIHYAYQYQQQQQPFELHSRDEANEQVYGRNKVRYGPSSRLYFSGNIGNNYLIKTSYAFTTSTATVCTLTTCIPAASFSVGSSNVICRRKRNPDDLPMLEDILASKVNDVETTVILGDANFEENDARAAMSAYPVIESSIEAGPADQREKRFALVLSTTFTSYEIKTATYTVTIYPAVAPQLLACRPSNYFVC